MRGSEPWNPNAMRVSERILVSALDPGRVGLTEHRSCADIVSSPTSPTGSSVGARLMDGHSDRVSGR